MIPKTIRVRSAKWGTVDIPLALILRVELFRGDPGQCYLLDREGQRIRLLQPFRQTYNAVIEAQARLGIRGMA